MSYITFQTEKHIKKGRNKKKKEFSSDQRKSEMIQLTGSSPKNFNKDEILSSSPLTKFPTHNLEKVALNEIKTTTNFEQINYEQKNDELNKQMNSENISMISPTLDKF